MPSRRAFLALTGGTLAGCVGETPGTGTPHSPTPTETRTTAADQPPLLTPGESFAADGGAVTVADPAVHVSVVSRTAAGSSVHPDVAASYGSQFLLLSLDGAKPETFAVTLDREVVDQPFHETIEPDDGKFACRVPVGSVSTARVHWRPDGRTRATWKLPDDLRDRLAARPAFEVREFDVAETVSVGEAIDVTLRVANVGDRDGRFVAELGAIVLSDIGEVWFDVPRGQAVTKEFSFTPSTYTPMYGQSEDELPVVCDWGTGRQKKTVRLRDGTTTSG